MKKILLFLFAVLLLTGCKNKEEEEKFQKLEDSFIGTVSTYYEENVLGQVYPPYECQEITISDVKSAGMSVNEYINAGCSEDDSAIIVVTDSSEPTNIKYEVIPNLSCGNYSSNITDEQTSKYQCLSLYVGK